MKYEKLTALLTTTLTPPPVISAADAHELVVGAQAVADWCAARMDAVPPPYRVNSGAAVDCWSRCTAAAKRVRAANTAELAQREAQVCYQFAVQVARDADIDRDRVTRQIIYIDQERASNRRAAAHQAAR